MDNYAEIGFAGLVNISGLNLNDLLERAHHAADYLTGRITE